MAKAASRVSEAAVTKLNKKISYQLKKLSRQTNRGATKKELAKTNAKIKGLRNQREKLVGKGGFTITALRERTERR